MSNRRIQSTIIQYKPPAGKHPIFKLIANFLVEASNKKPLDFFSYSDIARAVFSESNVALSRKSQLEIVRHSISKARDHAWEAYGKGLEIKKGFGARVTIGAADSMNNDFLPHQNRLYTSAAKLAAKAKKIDRKELAQAPMGALLLKAHAEAQRVTSQIVSSDVMERIKQLKENNE
jgi:hypothetical protein